MPRVAFALLLVLSSGCLRSTTTIDLRADGSGTIVQETGMTAQAFAMMKALASANPTSGPTTELFTEEQARKAAATMGVTFVSGEPFKTAELEGYRARYAFDDVSKIRVNMDQNTAGVAARSEAKQPPFGFTFDRRATSSVLTIQMPGQTPGMPGTFPGLPGGSPDTDKAQAAQALAMMKMMMKGLFVDISLNVNGRILKSNAPFVEGSRVTLMQIDFDKMLADESALQKLQTASDLKAMTNVPGLKVVSEPKLMIEFTR